MTFAARTLGYSAPDLLTFQSINVLGNGATCAATLRFNTDGTWDVFKSGTSSTYVSGTTQTGNYHSPTTVGIGSSYWVRFTKTADNSASGGSATASTGWLNISAARSVVASSGALGIGDADYLVELSTGSGGTPLIASQTISLIADNI